jgi:hypothetical protein
MKDDTVKEGTLSKMEIDESVDTNTMKTGIELIADYCKQMNVKPEHLIEAHRGALQRAIAELNDNSGVALIKEERRQQIEKHNKPVEYDAVVNNSRQLTYMATVLLGHVIGMVNPEGWNDDICQKMRDKKQVEKLAIAGALIAAEIDRLNHE